MKGLPLYEFSFAKATAPYDSHYLRMDYPETDNKEWLKWILISQENGELKFRLEDVPIDKYPMKPKEAIFVSPFRERRQVLPW